MFQVVMQSYIKHIRKETVYRLVAEFIDPKYGHVIGYSDINNGDVYFRRPNDFSGFQEHEVGQNGDFYVVKDSDVKAKIKVDGDWLNVTWKTSEKILVD